VWRKAERILTDENKKNKTKIHGGNLVHCVYVCVLLRRRLFALFSFIVSFFGKDQQEEKEKI
jgi:hypothetical protein